MSGVEDFRSRRFEGRAAWVTGASGGIGAAVARRLAAEGASVGLTARREAECAERAAEIEAEGGRALSLPADVTDPAALRQVVKALQEGFGRLDVVVAGAGVELVKPFTTLREADWQRVLQVNLVGAANTIQAAMPLLARQGGSVVIVSSLAGVTGATLSSAYAAAKGGALALARSLAKELAPRRIRVNALAPGMVRTEMFDRITHRWSEEDVAAMERAHPLGFGEPEDVAGAAAFLAGDDAKWVTGATLVVDGGLSVG